MRGNFLKKFKLENLIKISTLLTAIIAILFWGTIADVLTFKCIERKYLYPLKYKEYVFYYSDYYGLDRALVFSIIKVESSFDKNAVSQAGAVGLMQITPSTAEYVSKLSGEKEYNLTNEDTNIKFGCFYLKYLFDRFNERDTVICAYNAGEGNVNTWLKNKEYSKDGKTLLNVPFAETKEYRAKIHKSYKKYKEIYKNILDK